MVEKAALTKTIFIFMVPHLSKNFVVVTFCQLLLFHYPDKRAGLIPEACTFLRLTIESFCFYFIFLSTVHVLAFHLFYFVIPLR